MSEIVSIVGLGNSIFGTVLNIFNSKSIRTKVEFEKIVEPSYLSVKELHSDYIKSFMGYKSIISSSDMHLKKINALINKIDDDILLSEDLRNKLVAITQSISKENKKYSEYLKSLLAFINCIIAKREIRLSYELPWYIDSYEREFIKSIEENDEIIIDKKLLKKIIERNINPERKMCSNIGRVIIIETLEAQIRDINKIGSNRRTEIQKRAINEIDYFIMLLNINMKHIENNYWKMKKDIYK